MADHAKIKTQIEYYLSDKNLTKDKFFREQIQTSKDGYIAISHFLNCNNVKANQWTGADIKAACGDSTELEIKGDTIRRVGNKPLPEKSAPTGDRKRDQKGNEKKESNDVQEDEYDEDGKVILTEKDFDNPIIVSYDTKV